MIFSADFHIHSKYSRATSKDMILENIDKWAKIKGIDLIGTSDFTHPEWFDSIKSQLIEDKEGLYTVKGSNFKTRFVLSSEISFIYKKKDKVRKIHIVYLAPDIKTVEKINNFLSKKYNIKSDGRPILGADPKEITKVFLDINDKIIIIPAHIFTPWFSILGEKSGFDSIQNCFEEIFEYVYAYETGLSADPIMCSNLSQLNKLTTLSNSDAHSPINIGREVNIFNAELNYNSIYNAIKNKMVFKTIEFYPQQGKYHYDGHRKCNIGLTPKEVEKLNNRCPVCGKNLTYGVLHRIYDLRDTESKPDNFSYQIPLHQLISLIYNKGEKTKTVMNLYFQLIERFENELNVLHNISINELSKFNEKISYVINKLRKDEIIVKPGYDGEYGKLILN